MPAQVHTNPALAIWFLPMNLHERPFDDMRVRRAVNMAIDRDAAVKLFGGPRLAVPSCQIMPPGMPGLRAVLPVHARLWRRRSDWCGQSGTAGMAVTLVIDTSAVQRAIGTYVLDVLRQLGFDARPAGAVGQSAIHLHPEYRQPRADQPDAVVFGLSGGDGFPAAAVRLRVLPSLAATGRSISPGCATRRWMRACRRWWMAATRPGGPRSTGR